MNQINRTLRAAVVALALMPVGGSARGDDLIGPPAQAPLAPDLKPADPAPAKPAPLPEREKLKLGKPVELSKGDAPAAPAGAGVMRTVGSLGLVLLLAVGAAWGVRKFAGKHGGLASAVGAGGRAPSGILSILGRYPLGRGQTLVLLKVDRRVLLVAQTRFGRWGSQANLSTLTEITGEAEVASIVAKAQGASGDSPAARFERELTRADRAGELVPDSKLDRPRTRAAQPQNQPQSQPQAQSKGPPGPESAAVAELKRKLAALRVAGSPAVKIASANRAARGAA